MFSTKNDLTSHKYKLSFHKSSEFRNCTATGMLYLLHYSKIIKNKFLEKFSSLPRPFLEKLEKFQKILNLCSNKLLYFFPNFTTMYHVLQGHQP